MNTNDELQILDFSEEFEIISNESEVEQEITEETEETKEVEEEKETKEEKSEVETESETDENPLILFAKELKERQILNSETDIEDEDTLFQAMEKSIEQKANEKLELEFGYLSDEKVKGFLNYLKNGGNVDDYIQIEQNLTTDIDLENDEEVDEFLHYYLENFNNIKEKEDREDFIENLRVKGKIKEKTQGFLSNLETLKEQEKIRIQTEQANKIAELKRKQEENASTIKSLITKGDIEGIEIKKSKRESFENFLFKPIVKEINGKKVATTEFKEKFDEYTKNPVKFTRLAYELFENFSNQSLKEKVESETKSKLMQALNKKKPIEKNNDIQIQLI